MMYDCLNGLVPSYLQYCPKVLDPHFDEFPGFSGLFDEVSLETKDRRYFGEFSGRLLS